MSLDELSKLPLRKALRMLEREERFVLEGKEYLEQAAGYVPDGKNTGRALSAWLDVVNAYNCSAELVHSIAERYGRSRRRFWSSWEIVKQEYKTLCTELVKLV